MTEASAHDAHVFLEALALVLGTAAVTTVLFQRVRQPVVLGYLLAGLLVGPHVAFPLFADPGTIHTISELGVILLMFSLGLEFRLGKLIALAPTAGITGVLQCSVLAWLGTLAASALGWSPLECLFTGAILAISSTTIIAKAFDEQDVRGPLRELVVGVLIVEDLVAVLLMAILTAVATGSGLSAGDLATTTGRLLVFLVGLVGIGLLVVPRAMRAIVALGRDETTVVASVGLCFAIAFLAHAFGYSVALGAFVAGSLVAESGLGHGIGRRVQPVRDVFAAIFFVSVGMLIDPQRVIEHAGAIAALTALVVAGKVVSVAVGAFLTGARPRTAIQAGMSLAQIGEFSFIIAGLGMSLGATRDFLYPVAVAVSAITTLTTPWLIRASGPFASFVDRSLPKPLQTFVALYGEWIERLRRAERPPTLGSAARRLAGLLVLDAAAAVALIAGASLAQPRIAAWISARTALAPPVASAVVVVLAAAVSLPFLVGIVRVARRLATLLAQAAFPPRSASDPDFAAAPRRTLVAALELGIVLLVALPLVAATQPFLGRVPAGLLAFLVVASLGVVLWRRASDLEGHVRAGSQVIVELLASQSAAEERTHAPPTLEGVDRLLPGLGAPTTVRVDESSPVVGRSLGEIDLRGVTGATVLAIRRGDAGVSLPAAQEVLRAGDVLALAGSEACVQAARDLVSPGARGSV